MENDLKIQSSNGKTHIFIDGVELPRVCRFELTQSGQRKMRLTVEQSLVIGSAEITCQQGQLQQKSELE